VTPTDYPAERLQETDRYCVGLDIGGSKIAAAVVTPNGEIVIRTRAPTPRTGAPAILDACRRLVIEVTAAHRPLAIGVASPGVVDVDRGVVISATDILPGWAGTAVGDALGCELGFPVAVDNDVRAMATGEAQHGAGRGVADAVYVSVGTGVGGAIVRKGRICRGPHATAGEIAHLLVPTTGPITCGCGRRDHVEAVASGPAIEANYARQTGRPLALREIAKRMQNGDADAGSSIRDAATLLGRALGGLVSAIDTARVVVGGGVAHIGNGFVAPLALALRAEVLTPLRDVAVVPAQLGTDAPLIGAAMLAFDLVASHKPTRAEPSI
jgi:glucokinase